MFTASPIFGTAAPAVWDRSSTANCATEDAVDSLEEPRPWFPPPPVSPLPLLLDFCLVDTPLSSSYPGALEVTDSGLRIEVEALDDDEVSSEATRGWQTTQQTERRGKINLRISNTLAVSSTDCVAATQLWKLSGASAACVLYTLVSDRKTGLADTLKGK